MNEKLKQSLQGRLDGMRWGEREQAEVFRQIRKKEMQDVKQIKRGSGLLAMAVVLLFLVMGSAYAVSQRPQAEDRTRLSQNPQTTSLPAAAAQVENEYITLTVDNASWDGANASFDATIRLKEPDRYALSVGGYSNPGSEAREVLSMTLSAECITQVTPTHASGTLIHLTELLDMTRDAAVVRMSSDQVNADAEEIRFTLTLAAQGTQTAFTSEMAFVIPRSPVGTTSATRQLLFSNSLVSGYLQSAYHTGAFTVVGIELEPTKPWYAINADEPDKSSLQVTASDMTATAAGSLQALASAPVKIDVPADVTVASATLTYPEAQEQVTLRCEITATDPVTGSSVTQPVTLTVSALEAQQTAEVTPSPAPAVAAATPQPTAAPVPMMTNEHITMTVDNATWDGANASFEATIRLKEPDKYALSIDGYSNPGSEGREVLNVSLSAQSVLSTEPVYQTYSVFNLPELMNMTEDSATIRMSGKMALEGQDSIDFNLWLAADGNQTSFIAELPFTFRQSNPEAVAAYRRLLFSNSLLNCYLIAARHADTSGIFTIELEPAKPWYAIGTDEPGKSDLLVSVSDVIASEAASMQVLTTAPMNIAAQDGVARASAILSFPEEQAYVTFRCEITATDPVTGNTVSQPVTLTVSALERQQAAEVTPSPAPAVAVSTPQPTATPAPTPFRMWLFENDALTAYSVAGSISENQLEALLTIDLIPKSTGHVINTTAPGKQTLNVSAIWLAGYDGETPLRQVEELQATILPTEEGARFTVSLPFPEENERVTVTGLFTTQDGENAYENRTLQTIYRPGAYPAATPQPAAEPTVTPAPTALPTPTGKVLGGSDIVTVWLEESWYDGFSAEATLRIRADDPANRLALRPNESGAPSDSIWVVQTESSLNDAYVTRLPTTLTREETTGDILVHLTYEDLQANQLRMASGHLYPLTLPLTITATSERSWARSTANVTVTLEPPEMEDIQPLYLVEGSGADVFVQGSMLTTDRYRYIGVMLASDRQYLPSMTLQTADGTELTTNDYANVTGNSLLIFPRVLFPYEGDRESQFQLLVLQMDKDTPLPETLPVQIMQYRNGSKSELAMLHLSTEPRVMAERTLIEGQYTSVVLTNVSTGEGWTTGRLRIDLKDPRAYSLINYGPDHPAEHLDVNLRMTAMSATEEGDLRSLRASKLLSTDGLHSNKQEFFFTCDVAEWAASDERTVLAEMSVRDADGVTLETQSVTLALPQRGGVTRYRLVRTEDTPMENLEYHGGTLVVSPDACYAEMTYRCTGNCTQAGFFPYVGGEVLDYRLRYTDAYPAEKNPVKITQLWWEPDGPVPETIDFIVEDANHSPHPEIARFTVRVEPISE